MPTMTGEDSSVYISSRPHQNKLNGIMALNSFVAILDSLNIKYFLEKGTCLGVVRDNDFIPWDNDIDIGIISDEKKMGILILELWGLGFDLVKAKTKQGLKHIHLAKYNIFLDIQFWHKGRKYYTCIEKRDRIPICFLKNLDTIKFGEKEYPIPSPVEEYLEYMYGKDWTTPKYRSGEKLYT